MKLDYFIGQNIKQDYFKSDLVDRLSQSGEGMVSAGKRLTVTLPARLGFCPGVMRAIRMAMHTVEKYPGRKIYLLNEMIHNPTVNNELQKIGIQFLEGIYHGDGIKLEEITSEDVVIIPAFGGNEIVTKELTRIGCTVIDTTCGEVLSVWKRIQKYNSAGFTVLFFGHPGHEETIAATSRANRYLVIKDELETNMVANYIQSPSASGVKELVDHFHNRCSERFDPEIDLRRIGLASQTTMVARKFIQVAEIIRQAIISRYLGENQEDHFWELNTICNATQERQDAVQFIQPKVDLMIVVGGYNSSNTKNLARIASEHNPTYHIDGIGKILPGEIQHLPVGSKNEIRQTDWLPKLEHIKIGITSGASTPDLVLEQVIQKVLNIDGRTE